MGKIGTCCCGCCTDISSEFPTFTISGMTVCGNESSSCCKEQTFCFTSSQASREVCVLKEIHSATWKRDRKMEVFAYYLQKPKVFLESAPCPLPDQYCCPTSSSGVRMGYVTETQTTMRKHTFKFTYWPARIIVRYSKQLVECDGVTSCKYLVHSRYEYDYKYLVALGGSFSAAVASVSDGGCFGKMAGTDDFSLSSSFSDSCGFDFISAYPSTPALQGTGSFGFDRIRYYDTPPTGNISFSGSDLKVCSDSGACKTDGDYSSSTCVYPPSSGVFGGEPYYVNQPCWCTAVSQSSTTLNCNIPNTCNGRISSAVYSSCELNDPELGCGLGAAICDDSGRTPDPCFTISSIIPSVSASACSGLWNPTIDLYWSPTDDYDEHIGGGGAAIGPAINPKANCSDTDPKPFTNPDCTSSTRAGCNSSCCWVADTCTACDFYMTKCFDKLKGGHRTITQDDVTITCNTNSNPQVCVSAPTWSVTLL